HDGALDGYDVAVADGLHEVGAKAGPGEDFFCYNRTTQKGSELETYYGYYGKHGISQDVPEDLSGCEAFCAGGANEVAGFDFKDAAAGHAGDESGTDKSKSDCGQRHVPGNIKQDFPIESEDTV